MSKHVRIHIHAENPNTIQEPQQERVETLCEEYRTEEKVISITEYLRWVTTLGKTALIFCGHCRSTLQGTE